MTAIFDAKPLVTSPASPEERETFTEGSCLELARALQERLEGGLVFVASMGLDGPTGWYHAALRLEDELILDVEGLWSPEGFLAHWQDELPEEAAHLKIATEGQLREAFVHLDDNPINVDEELLEELETLRDLH